MNELWKHGRPGDPIPGSRYVRAYCPDCGDPMRVSREVWESDAPLAPCLDCDPCREPTDSTLAATMQRDASTPLDLDVPPAWANGVRHMEECA